MNSRFVLCFLALLSAYGVGTAATFPGLALLADYSFDGNFTDGAGKAPDAVVHNNCLD